MPLVSVLVTSLACVHCVCVDLLPIPVNVPANMLESAHYADSARPQDHAASSLAQGRAPPMVYVCVHAYLRVYYT